MTRDDKSQVTPHRRDRLGPPAICSDPAGLYANGLGEGAFGWIGGRDKVTDAFGKRVSHFVLLLGLVLACCAAFAAVIWMAQ